MSDGHPTPRAHDGMAAFRHKGKIRLVRNHEINNRSGKPGLCIGNKDHAYDPLAGGGTSTLTVDPKTRELLSDYISLSGTLQNCAGGPTPWGSWITCEETILGKTSIKTSQGESLGSFEQNHGYCFEVPALSDKPASPIPLKQMGRFVHEAIAVDPKSGIVYLTEDIGTAGFYRFLPNRKEKLAEGGRLQMLAVKGKPEYDARMAQKVGAKIPVVWVDIANPDPPEADSDPLAVYKQGKAKGGATFTRLEGCWYGDKRIFFTSTSGGDKRLGQVWEYQPDGKTEGTLVLLFESPGAEVLDMPDNITVSPRGGLVLCEDGSREEYIRGLTRDGRIFDFAKNIVPGFEQNEFAGATFSPDGETLFVNIQTPGITFAIWGPWKDGAL
jgi:secreted PhoX family phosphatase